MGKLIGALAGVAISLGLVIPSAHAGETVFTDEGWYRVEGNAPTPQVDEDPSALQATPAMPTPPGTAAQPGMPMLPRMAPPPPPSAPRSCIEQRGTLARRLLTLHGFEVSKADVSDEDLGAMGVASLAAPMPFTASLTLDPDLNLLEGNLPIPPSSTNWDEEARQDWKALVECESD
jgi:hypothetical protein